MSLYGMMRTGGSGMNAQANRLGTVADNIANASTTGYKAASTEFSTLLLASGSGSYNSGAVQSQVRYNISQQGALTYTSSSTDLAINGNGFFVVQDAGGTTYMTRAGSFQPNAIGELVNAGGFKLLGYPYTVDNPTPVVNGFDGLVPVTVGNGSLVAKASTSGVFFSNLESTADVVTGTLPDTNAPDSEYTHKSSLKIYDSLGNEVLLDIYFTKTEEAATTGDPDKWQVTIFNAAYRDPTTGSFPYTQGPLDLYNGDPDSGGTATSPYELEFDPATGKLSGALSDLWIDGVTDRADDGTAGIWGLESLRLDLSATTQLNYEFSVLQAEVNGNAPSEVEKVQISADGIVYAQYASGDLLPIYRLAMATVQSPDKLTSVSSNVYLPGIDSGVVVLGFPGNSGFGEVVSGALESSTVDIAQELTNMIEAQRTYTANSKVFQTGSDLMEVLVNLKR